jgi:hypothetical protein
MQQVNLLVLVSLNSGSNNIDIILQLFEMYCGVACAVIIAFG